MNKDAAEPGTRDQGIPDHDSALGQMPEGLESLWRHRINDVTELTVRVHDLRTAIDEAPINRDRVIVDLTEAEARLAFARRGLADSDAALQRFARGTYGFCGHCEASIEPDRLAVQPDTKLCGSCLLWSGQA
jgi:RNA polymerase-binding transcription factor DksA